MGLSSMPDFTNILEPVGYGFHYLDAEAHADQDAAETSHVEMINNPICNRKTSVVSSSGDVVPVGVDKYRLDLHTDCIEPIRISPHGEDSLQSSVLMMHPAPDTGFDRGWQVDTVHNPGSQSARSRVAATGRSYMQVILYISSMLVHMEVCMVFFGFNTCIWICIRIYVSVDVSKSMYGCFGNVQMHHYPRFEDTLALFTMICNVFIIISVISLSWVNICSSHLFSILRTSSRPKNSLVVSQICCFAE